MSDFDHLQNSPDIKLKSIEIDEDLGAHGPNDKSGTGHGHQIPKKSTSNRNAKQTLVAANTYGGVSQTILVQKHEHALNLLSQMQACFHNFKQKHEEGISQKETATIGDTDENGRSHSVASLRSTNSTSSQ